MTVTIIEADAEHRESYTIECTADEPDEVRKAFATIQDHVRRGLRGIPNSQQLIDWANRAKDEHRRNNGEPTEKMRRAMFAMANDLGLERQDRIDLAEMILERDCTTWGDLSFEEASKLLTAMNGYVLIRHLKTRT